MGLLSVLYFSKPVFMWALAFDVLLEPKYECLTSLGLGDFYHPRVKSDLQNRVYLLWWLVLAAKPVFTLIHSAYRLNTHKYIIGKYNVGL